ncbi:MAG: AI-2E family transporter [Ruminococcaceae bacterium]|nr:AI-2E family transporter [Oscillospiraceae bacterium]
MELNNKNTRRILLIITFTILLFLIAQNLTSVWTAIKTIAGFFTPVIVGLCVAFVLNILLSGLENHVFAFMKRSKRKFVRKLCRPVSLILTLLITLGIIVVFIVGIIPELVDLFTSLSETIPKLAGDLMEWIEGLMDKFNIAVDILPNYTIDWERLFDTIIDFLTNSSGDLVGGAVNVTTSILSGAVNAVFSIVIAVYVMAKKERVGHFTTNLIKAIVPQKYADSIFRISSITYSAFSNFISGQLTESLILGTLCFIGMLILRLPNAVIISIAVCITSIVPIVGAFVGVAIGTVLLLIESPIKALIFLSFILILQQVEGSVIYPKVVGKSVGLPGLIVFCAVLVGGNIGGVAGALLGVPLSAVVYTLVKEFINTRVPHEPAPETVPAAAEESQPKPTRRKRKTK